MVENAIRVGSEAAAADIPAVIADWSRRHPNLYGDLTAGDWAGEQPDGEPTNATDRVERAAPGTVPVEPAP